MQIAGTKNGEKRIWRVLKLGAVLFGLLAGPASAQVQGVDGACRVRVVAGSASRCDGCFTEVRIEVSKGGICRLTLIPGDGRIVGFAWPIRPKQGQIGAANESVAAYRAGSSAGNDYFEGRITFERRRKVGEPIGRVYFGEHLVRAHVTIR